MFDSTTLDQISNDAGLSGLPSEPAGILANITGLLFGIAGIILTFMLISAGYKMMTSAGDPKAMAAGQAQITNALLGVVIMFVSFWVVKLILQFFNITLTLF